MDVADADVLKGSRSDSSSSTSSSSSESSSSPPPPLPPPAAAPPPEAAPAVARARIPDELVFAFGCGDIRYYQSKNELYAICRDLRHEEIDGKPCLRARTCNASNRTTPVATGQGRPLGALAAWLIHDCPCRAEHKEFSPSFAERAGAREALQAIPAAAALLAKERARTSWEGDEPEFV